ncbi:DUF2786 domain-containing protein [Corynebacterium stationis]|uniref:DUF2786 domain-containing protein n=1 Tax=Corynebacterium stationis TaxID=1705 RepID=UPI00076F7B99|nr:DUF2786 domain-containing protein [Corynebacterium stationis]AMJ44273.1 hypothetical protein AW169_04645 [Corynebacterium stationis]AQX70728.1 hypothetical protein CA21670_03820 [Corynebacterium stationis]ASJ18417.1 hypothetical protein BA700_04640 [Corynebacterium stationis]HJG63510.1 DUF2786 domain-containing protein [Corynebacterium stationis]
MNRLHHLDPHLVRAFIHDIITVAQRGWMPLDLQHVLGPAVASVLEKAAPQIPARIGIGKIRHAWLSYRPSDHDLSLATTLKPRTIHAWMDKLYRLPFLRDAEVVSSAEPQFSDPKQKKMHDKIQGLLAKAESTQFEDEADALIAKAQNLRQQYRIDKVLEELETSAEEVVAVRVRIAAPWVKHQMSLLSSVACANGGTAVLLSDLGICTVLATRDDAEHIVDLFSSLNRHRAWFMTNSEGAKLAAEEGQTASYRRSFMLAYAGKIHELLHEANIAAAQQHQESTNNSTWDEQESSDKHQYEITSRALPALARRQTNAEEVLQDLFPNLSSMNLSMNHIRGIIDGVDAAERSHLGGDKSGIRTSRNQLAS